MDETALKSFVCQQCGECCRQTGSVYLSVQEADNIARLLQMDPYVFVNRYCDLFDRRKLVLKRGRDETCLFFVEGKCRIHNAKPKQCLDFPKLWRTPRSFQYCRGLRKTVGKDSKI